MVSYKAGPQAGTQHLADDYLSRFRVLTMPARTLVQFLEQGSREPVNDLVLVPRLPGLPEGYAIAGIDYDPHSVRFAIKVIHPSFPPVRPGAPAPVVACESLDEIGWKTYAVA